MIIPTNAHILAEYTATGQDSRWLPVVAFDTDVPPHEVAAMVCTPDGGLAYANDTEPAPGYVLERVALRPR